MVMGSGALSLDRLAQRSGHIENDLIVGAGVVARRPRGLKPYPAREGVPAFCGTCHSDAAFMRKYKPSQWVDQLARHRKSVHGIQFAQGNVAAANCIDCHGIHDTRAVNDRRSYVHPSRLAETFGGVGYGAVLKESAHAKAISIAKGMACSLCHSGHGPG